MFIQPTKEQIEKIREVYGDALLFWATNTALQSLNKLKDSDYSEFSARQWIRLTRLMIMNYPLILLHARMDDIFIEVSEKTWKDFQVPNLTSISIGQKSIDPSATKISQKIKISDIARDYGVEVKRGKAICPFHKDKDPSLSFSDEKGVFHCFGCKAKGDIVTFVRKMEELKNG